MVQNLTEAVTTSVDRRRSARKDLGKDNLSVFISLAIPHLLWLCQKLFECGENSLIGEDVNCTVQ